MEVQRDSMTCLRPHNKLVAKQGLEPVSSFPAYFNSSLKLAYDYPGLLPSSIPRRS